MHLFVALSEMLLPNDLMCMLVVCNDFTEISEMLVLCKYKCFFEYLISVIKRLMTVSTCNQFAILGCY